jgi:hypothetical protein
MGSWGSSSVKHKSRAEGVPPTPWDVFALGAFGPIPSSGCSALCEDAALKSK